MTTHSLKTDSEIFDAILNNEKFAEYRLNDRGFMVGDKVTFCSWHKTDEYYDGRQVTAVITHTLHGPAYRIPLGFCLFSFKRIDYQDRNELRPTEKLLTELMGVSVRNGRPWTWSQYDPKNYWFFTDESTSKAVNANSEGPLSYIVRTINNRLAELIPPGTEMFLSASNTSEYKWMITVKAKGSYTVFHIEENLGNLGKRVQNALDWIDAQ